MELTNAGARVVDCDDFAHFGIPASMAWSSRPGTPAAKAGTLPVISLWD